MLTRRFFMRNSALAMAGIGAVPAWLARASAATDGRRNKVLVAIFQRGAVDGLNMVVPHGDPAYYSLRPTIAIPKSDVLDLDGFFGLHPALKGLKGIYDSRNMAIVHAVGSPDPTRSHFDAQDYMESGTPGRKATNDGWLNRTMSGSSASSPVRGVALGNALPRAMRGSNPVVAVNTLGEFQVKDTVASNTFEGMYSSTLDKVLSGSGRETFDAVKTLQAIQKQRYVPDNGARYPAGRLGQSLLQIARLIKAGVGVEVAFADMGGWDTHVNEVGATAVQGPLANLLAQFGNALTAFYGDMGDRMEDVVVVTMSEFGRTARENGNRGTDHGHANAMLVMGGHTQGGRVYGDWPGLATEHLYEGRDLALTTDFRDVLTELVARHLSVRRPEAVFPGHTKPEFRGVLRA